jgi:hypothetical protein
MMGEGTAEHGRLKEAWAENNRLRAVIDDLLWLNPITLDRVPAGRKALSEHLRREAKRTQGCES